MLALILRDPTAVLRIVETLVLPRETQALVSEFLIYVSGNTSQVMFIAALFVMITSASAAFRAMAAIVSEIHGDKRFGIVSSTVVSVVFSVAFLLVLYLCVLLMLTGKRFLLWLDALMPRVSIIWSWTWVRFLVLFAILLMMILALYRLTTPRRPQHRVLPGAVFSAVAIVCMSILLSWLIGNSTKYSLVLAVLARGWVEHIDDVDRADVPEGVVEMRVHDLAQGKGAPVGRVADLLLRVDQTGDLDRRVDDAGLAEVAHEVDGCRADIDRRGARLLCATVSPMWP